MESYFRLAEQFRTQDDPSFCGLSSLTMVLNALAVDPGRTWKGEIDLVSQGILECTGIGSQTRFGLCHTWHLWSAVVLSPSGKS